MILGLTESKWPFAVCELAGQAGDFLGATLPEVSHYYVEARLPTPDSDEAHTETTQAAPNTLGACCNLQ